MTGPHVAMHQERETNSHEKRKRKLKTPAQIEALEKFYNEHKYPTEVMKLEFSEKIGLSEKQVSGWFCHRRLKDKKTLQGEICTNGKQNLSSSAVHDRISGVKQESCSSTKQVDRNLDFKEVESKMYYGYRPCSDVLAYETSNKHPRTGIDHVAEDRSSGSSSASQGSYLESHENPYVVQASGYKLCNDSGILMSNKNRVMKSNENMGKPRHSFMRVENDTPAISELKWKLGSHYREDGPLLGFEFDPIPPGAFDSPTRDSKFEPYYVGDTMQQEASSFYRSTNEHREGARSTGLSSQMYDKYNNVKSGCKAYQEQRSSKRAKPGFIDFNEINNLQATQNAISNHVQYQVNAMDETEKSMNHTSCFNVRNNLRCFKEKTEGRYDSRDGHNLHRNFWNSNQNHSACKPDMVINKTARKVNGVELWQQQCAVKVLEKPARQVPFKRHHLDMESNLQRDVSGGTSSSLD
ncbi:homeobox-DDT domain protein RLT1 isoform X2 [Phalaenopsis equestris]|uniref:homeobox-DDT domain protein RLT1 isoform X2 n=2 Tax=Phalaenopsis equestris TaxID=78828 RepID=UPI0009E30051|nr:homeobox-DDT domain protein RLT1 isoform X2 [Phalaenopsis equestris]